MVCSTINSDSSVRNLQGLLNPQEASRRRLLQMTEGISSDVECLQCVVPYLVILEVVSKVASKANCIIAGSHALR